MNPSRVVSFSGAPKISFERAAHKKTRRDGSYCHDPKCAALRARSRRMAHQPTEGEAADVGRQSNHRDKSRNAASPCTRYQYSHVTE